MHECQHVRKVRCKHCLWHNRWQQEAEKRRCTDSGEPQSPCICSGYVFPTGASLRLSSRLVLCSQSTEQFVSGLQKNYASWSEHWTKDALPEIVESTFSYRWSTAQGV